MTCYIDPNHCLSWDALLPYVQPYALGAPDEVILQAVRTSAIEFCRRSGILHDKNVIDLQALVRDYPLETLCDYEIVRIFRVNNRSNNVWNYSPSFNEMPRGATFSDLSIGFDGYPYYDWGQGAYGYSFYVQQPNIIVISRPPAQDLKHELNVEFVVQPKQDGCTLDNSLYESWAEAIAYGAIARLLMMPNTSWYSAPIANQYQVKYRTELGRARTAEDLNFTSGPKMMKTQRWV